jgi:Mn2+/Fe2+ NRAMP family transporter
VCEGLGFESGVDKKFKQAPFFYWLYTLLIVAGAAVVLIPNFPYVKMIVLSQVLNGVLLPFVLYFMLRLANNKALMGKHVNGHSFNVIAWATAVIVVGLSVMLFWQQIHSMMAGS